MILVFAFLKWSLLKTIVFFVLKQNKLTKWKTVNLAGHLKFHCYKKSFSSIQH